ncbi:hypothetical protein [Arthrobacter sp. YN]|uniref:hypothetical protein n=1 Tax=Arthrobacter sp. YN TaxID=2020486 RepID=UPI000B5ED32E|nr:hypothetical protein [Arthrobacter sp. YN]ASN19917.1 hypothetical protein CGK93_09700 [Arthrobacter sp. YN]
MSIDSWPAEPADDRDKRPWVYLRLIHEGLQIDATELRDVIQRPSNDANLRSVVFEPGPQQEEYFGELYVRLHNYVAVVATLIAVSRIYVRKNTGAAFRALQQERVAALGESVPAQILQGLRNYVVHYNVPYMEMTVEQSVSPYQMSSILHISSKSLLDCRGWKPAAERYLQEVPMVNLGRIVDDYTDLVNEYYSWFWAAVGNLDKDGS